MGSIGQKQKQADCLVHKLQVGLPRQLVTRAAGGRLAEAVWSMFVFQTQTFGEEGSPRILWSLPVVTSLLMSPFGKGETGLDSHPFLTTRLMDQCLVPAIAARRKTPPVHQFTRSCLNATLA